MHPTQKKFIETLDKIKALHIAKAKDYGEDHDPLANVRNGGEFVNIESWRACLVRVADKIQRIKTFCKKGNLTNESLEDSFLDLASYAIIAHVLYTEEREFEECNLRKTTSHDSNGDLGVRSPSKKFRL